MKRKVRIYKDPFGNGGYINKTAQWLRKADEGIQTGPTPVTQGIMQQMQSGQPQKTVQGQPQQDPQEQILKTVVTLAQKGYGQDEIKDYLLQDIYGFDKNSQEYVQYEPQVLDFVSAVFERLGSEEEEDDQTYVANVPTIEETDSENVAETNNYGDEELMNDILFDDSDDDDDEARYGGVPNKRSYINKLARKIKKAQKGDQVEEANTANVRGTEDNPTGTTGNKNIFVEGVKGQAENYFIKEQAKQMYNNKFGQGMPQSQNDMDYAQFGGMRMRRANRKMFGTPFAPMGVTSSKYSFGPFGGLRSADVQFNPMILAQMFPMMSFPGMGGMSSWGYNEPYKKRSPGRLVTEKIASAVNNKAITDVANSTGSPSADTTGMGPCTEDEVKDPNNKRCYDPMYAGHGPVATDQNAGVTNTSPIVNTSTNTSNSTSGGNRIVQPSEIKDKWGRPEGSKWYGFDPDTKEWTKGKPDWKIEEGKKNRWKNVTMKKDSWGRNEDSKWYGYDPKKKKYTEGSNKGKTATQVKNKLEKEKHEESVKKWGPKITAMVEYEDWKKNASTTDLLLNSLGFYGPKDPKIHGGFTEDDPLSYLVPGIKGGSAAINLIKNQNLLGQGAKGAAGALNSGQKLLNPGQKLLNPGQKLLNPGQKLLNPGQGLLEAPAGTQLVLPFPNLAFGGPVNNPMQDQFGNLQKFVYGDQVDDQMLEDLYQPPINQSDLDYSDSKDVTDAYFMHGGLHRYDDGGEGTTEGEGPKTYTKEELDKILADKQKSWETDYQTKAKQQQMQQMQQYMNPMGSYNYGFRGSPMFGVSSYSPGLLGAAGRFAGSFFGGRQSQYSPVGNPLQYAATAAGITKAGMLPTGMKYSKEKAAGLLGKLGLKHDKTWTIDYATPEQIKAGVIPGTTTGTTAPGTTSSSTTPGLSGRDRRIARRDERKNRGIAPEADAEAFTSTLTGSTEPEGPSKNAQQELINFQANQRRQGLTVDPKTQRWVKGDSPLNNINASSPTSLTKEQGADLVTGTPGISVGNLPSQQGSGVSIYRAFGGEMDYIPEYMAYGGYIPKADQGINVSSVSYAGNPVVGVEESPTWGAMQYFNQNQNIKNPDADKFKNYTVEPDDDDLSDCTYEQKIDPTSKCYDPQTAQLKFKEEKGPAGQKAANIMGSALDFGALLADDMNYATERRTKLIPGMTEFARGEKQSANEVINKGEWNARTGKEGIQGFEGVIRKGGAIKNKKSNASGHKIDMNDFQSLLKLAGLI